MQWAILTLLHVALWKIPLAWNIANIELLQLVVDSSQQGEAGCFAIIVLQM